MARPKNERGPSKGSRAVLSETARELLSSDSASPYPKLGLLTRNDRREHSKSPISYRPCYLILY
jgi:hypothetical protein